MSFLRQLFLDQLAQNVVKFPQLYLVELRQA